MNELYNLYSLISKLIGENDDVAADRDDTYKVEWSLPRANSRAVSRALLALFGRVSSSPTWVEWWGIWIRLIDRLSLYLYDKYVDDRPARLKGFAYVYMSLPCLGLIFIATQRELFSSSILKGFLFNRETWFFVEWKIKTSPQKTAQTRVGMISTQYNASFLLFLLIRIIICFVHKFLHRRPVNQVELLTSSLYSRLSLLHTRSTCDCSYHSTR